jgi:biopolymer transport protein ExbD
MPDLTPLLGVLLVIVVSFMAALPSPKTLDVKLPIDVALLPYVPTPPSRSIDDPIIQLESATLLTLNGELVTADQLKARLTAWFPGTKSKTVYILAAPSVRYGDVASLVDIAKASGAKNIVMIPDSLRSR